MNFITMLCLALANCEQFMSLSKAEDHGVSARSDLAEIDDLNLTMPSPLQRLLSSADDDEEEEDETDEADEDGENEEADESEVEDGKKGWVTPVNGLVGGLVGGLVAGGSAVGFYNKYYGAKTTTSSVAVEPKEKLIKTFLNQEAADKFAEEHNCTVEPNGDEANSYKFEMTLKQLKELPQWKAFTEELKTAGITLETEPAAVPGPAVVEDDTVDTKVDP